MHLRGLRSNVLKKTSFRNYYLGIFSSNFFLLKIMVISVCISSRFITSHETEAEPAYAIPCHLSGAAENLALLR